VAGWVYLFALGDTGLLGPDEPRYAFIGREMAESGDWITPRLWGKEWFEKPALLYWLIGLGHRAGLKAEWAARAPVALLSLAFLCLYYMLLKRLGGGGVARAGLLLLTTSAGWIAFSQVAATDLPLAATFGAGTLLLLVMSKEEGWTWPLLSGVCFGLALLAKGLVPAVLALPLAWRLRKDWRKLLVVGVAAVAVASTWYGPMFYLHGRDFFNDFFLKHHFGRFASEELQHVQPFWFYVPVLAGWLYPWPLLALTAWRSKPSRASEWARTLTWTVGFGLVFFSISTNKLPGYVLPLLPLLCAATAERASQAEELKRGLFWTGFSLFLIPVAATILPEALLHGITKASWDGVPWEYPAIGLCAGAMAWWLERQRYRLAALGLLSSAVLAGMVYVKLSAFPVLDRVVSARWLAVQIAAAKEPACVEQVHRSVEYGLRYYVRPALPECTSKPCPLRVSQERGSLPALRRE
jgi:4-amino-4-deoxy-L-arabinose transferase-like glycosyltransferase